jgi:hypothetical protein
VEWQRHGQHSQGDEYQCSTHVTQHSEAILNYGCLIQSFRSPLSR